MSLCMIVSLLPVSAFALEDEGENPETETCICDTRCTEDNFNEDCPVCAADVLQCTGEEEQTGGEVPGEPETPGEPEEPSETEIPDETEVPGETEEPGETEIPNEPEPQPEPEPVPPANELLVPLVEDEENAVNAVYVSGTGDDTAGVGSKGNPYATLAKAVKQAKSGDTIYVMTDLTMTESARFWNKHLTITSFDPDEPVTLTRGTPFTAVTDPARGGYNGALIEVGGTSFNQESSLTLTNITLDDAGLQGGKESDTDPIYFIQADSESDGSTTFGEMEINNTDIVQDAMIATYNNTATITLGAGAVLKNYGGMSAVRISGGVLNMLDGSAIYDDLEGFTRSKGSTITGADSGLYGPAGAVWMQGGEFVMEQGAEIRDMVGRAIYNEAGNVQASGTFSKLTTSNAMWQGTGGAVMHMRVDAKATFGPTSVIDGQGATLYGSAISVLGNCELTMAEGSLVTGYSGGNVLDIGGTAYLNGEITGLTGDGHAICAQSSSDHYIYIGETANIHDNICRYGVIYTQGDNGVIDVYGKINNNLSTDRGGAIVLANNGTHVEVNMFPGAEMCGNVSTQTGGAVMVSCGTFTMYGGTISGNISGAGLNADNEDAVGGGVFVRRGGTFVMKGGEITDNHAVGLGGGVAVIMEDYNGSVPYVELSGGTISGNDHKATVTGNDTDGYQLEAAGTSNDITLIGGSTYSHVNRYFVTGSGLNLGNEQIYMADYGFYIDRIDGVKLGNAATACETAATNKYGVVDYDYLDTVVGSFWYQSDSNVTLDISGLSYDEDKLLFAAIVPTDETGAVDTAGESTLIAVTGGESFRLPLEGSANGYAVVFLQETQPSGIITVIPASLTAYMGGNGGYEGVVDGNGGKVDVEDSGSLPRPIFQVKGGPADVALTGLTFENSESRNSWTLEEVGGGYYRFKPVAENGVSVRVQYSDGTKVVTEDEFTPETDVFKEYTVTIYAGETAGEVQVNAADEYYTYTVITGPGVLTVRAVEADDPTSDIVDAITAPVTSGSATAVVPAGGTTYTLNNTGVELPGDAKPSLLFDNIITSDGVNRIDALENAVDTKLGTTNGTRNYVAKYLDLVDANNGNAWISSSEGTDIYWGYPTGTDKNTNFTLVHFRDLHRDGTESGFDIDDINSDNVEVLTTKDGKIVNTDYGIKFHVAKGGFSPFVLVWETAAEEPDPGTDPNPGGGGGDSHSDPTGNLTISLGGNGGNEDFIFTVIFTDEDGDELENNFYYNGDYTGTIGSGDEITLTGGDKIVIRNLPEGTRYEVIIETADGYTATSTGAEGVIRTSGNEAAFSVTPTVVLADPSVTGVTRWLNTTDHTAYLSGYPGGTFGPDNSMTRAEVAQMFYALLLNKDVTITKTFSDVPADAWYATAVNTLASLGMVSGDPDGTFRPNDPITRAEFCVIALAFAYEPDNAVCYFGDVSRSDWFYTYVAQAASYGWIGGYTNGNFGPNDQITRAQVTTIVNNMLGRAADRDYVIDHQADLVQFSDLTRAHWGYFQIMEATNAHNYTKSNGTESWR